MDVDGRNHSRNGGGWKILAGTHLNWAVACPVIVTGTVILRRRGRGSVILSLRRAAAVVILGKFSASFSYLGRGTVQTEDAALTEGKLRHHRRAQEHKSDQGGQEASCWGWCGFAPLHRVIASARDVPSQAVMASSTGHPGVLGWILASRMGLVPSIHSLDSREPDSIAATKLGVGMNNTFRTPCSKGSQTSQ